ncbi:PLDc N-terminal domain-containing protein [Facklamia sp. DSM 111018]|uniref:PLDc N-terminal domain-containing protein n=2 Tax=Facklamia lactis TaxID=2749967 RepID=A0ABS0LR14_9LACT|nr:PLDc N-terminal domain-containing protein [Facklamia lactis]
MNLEFSEYLPFLIPLIVLQIILVVIAIRKLISISHTKYLNKLLWGVIIVFINIIGPILFIAVEGRES